MTISAAQCRAARALIGLSQSKLSEMAKVSPATIASFESGKRTPYGRTLDDIVAVLEQEGVIFIAQNGNGPGVRLKDRIESQTD